jgi:hypothetical protein
VADPAHVVSAPIDIVIADDHAMVRAGLRLLLEAGTERRGVVEEVRRHLSANRGRGGHRSEGLFRRHPAAGPRREPAHQSPNADAR